MGRSRVWLHWSNPEDNVNSVRIDFNPFDEQADQLATLVPIDGRQRVAHAAREVLQATDNQRQRGLEGRVIQQCFATVSVSRCRKPIIRGSKSIFSITPSA